MMLSVIISTYKRPQLLKKCLAGAIELLDVIDSEIIVINDSKTDKVVVPHHNRIKVFDNPGQGIASTRNLGAAKASGDLLLFIDDDIEFNLKQVMDLLAQYEKREPAGYNTNWRYSDEMYNTIKKTQFGRFLIKYGLINYKGWVPDIPWQTQVFEAHKLAGFFMLMPKEFFTKAGCFNESFSNQGTEDDELCQRLKLAGVKMYVDPNNYVFHNEMDRVTLETRYQRYYNGAINRRKLFEMGDASYKINYTASKKMVLKLISPLTPLLFGAAKLIPNAPMLDVLYFKIANAAIAIAIYKGYTKDS